MEPLSPIEPLRWVGVAALCGMLLAALALQLTERFDSSRSVSQVWARSRRSYIFTGVSMSVFGALLCLSLVGWHIPAYRLPTLMYPLVALAYLALLAIAWVPMTEKPGEHSLLHPHFLGGAFVATGAIVGFACILLARPAVPTASYWSTAVSLAYASMWPLFMTVRLRRFFLLLEIGLVLLFVLVVTALTIGI